VTSFYKDRLQTFPRCLTALSTPFQNDEISEEAFVDLIAWQIEQGSEGLVVGGATGEASTLSDEEHLRLIRIAVETVDGRLPVVAATGSNCTRHSIALTQAAEAAGASAAMIVTPYYNKPTQDGLYRHYREIARSVGLPIIMENDPSSTCVDIRPETLALLTEIPNVIGIVDATGSFSMNSVNSNSVNSSSTASGFMRLSGDDATCNLFRIAGGQGSVSTIANVVPQLWADMQRACDAQDWNRAASVQIRLLPLLRALRLEPNPAPLKFALSLFRPRFKPDVRLPLVPVTDATGRAIAAALADLKMIE
jgi:4-hydroxy-tetrahydrodipicolinate synthase